MTQTQSAHQTGAGSITGARKLNTLRVAAGDIKIAHSVFALPFAMLAAFLAKSATEAWPSFLGKLALIAACMVTARTWAMLFNRIADKRLDAANPRTAARALPSGAMSPQAAWTMALASAAIFVLCTAGFLFFWGNAWPIVLSVPVLVWVAFYSLSKRFTWACHLFLGGALACSPVAAALATNPDSLAAPWPWLLAGMVVCWVAGFDIIYALQDVQIDRRQGLFSAPSRLGETRALLLSRLLHAAAVLLLAGVGALEPRLGLLYWIAVLGVGGLLTWEHLLILTSGSKRLNMAFFTLNGVVSCLVGAAVVVEVILSAVSSAS